MTRQQRQRNSRKQEHCVSAERMRAKHFEHTTQQRNAGAEQDEPNSVQRVRAAGPAIRQMVKHLIQACRANWQFDKGNCPPVRIFYDKAANDRTQPWINQRGHRQK